MDLKQQKLIAVLDKELVLIYIYHYMYTNNIIHV